MFVSYEAVSGLIAVLGVLFAYFTYKRSTTHDIQQATKDNVVISTKLDMVLTSLSNMENKLNCHDTNLNEIEIKVTEAIASCASAHKRIDELIGGKKND